MMLQRITLQMPLLTTDHVSIIPYIMLMLVIIILQILLKLYMLEIRFAGSMMENIMM